MGTMENGKVTQYILKKYKLALKQENPIEIPNVGRNDLAELFYELQFKTGAEVGVARGYYSKILCESNPNLYLHCIDCWKVYPGYDDYSQKRLNQFYRIAQEQLANLNCEIVKKFSMDAVKDFELNSLDFVYLDASHEFRDVVNDISEWIKRIKIGGIISGHDYDKSPKVKFKRHVGEAVKGYTESYEIKPWFILGRKKCPRDESRDKIRSWFWIKE